jgi:hypothetical protein
MPKEWSNVELIQKITRAEMKLAAIKERDHPTSCPMADHTSMGECNCGASAHNNALISVRDELKLVQ